MQVGRKLVQLDMIKHDLEIKTFDVANKYRRKCVQNDITIIKPGMAELDPNISAFHGN